MVYSAGGGSVQGPLIQMLRRYFEEHAQRSPDDVDALPTISAADALAAMRALGITPPSRPDGRPLHRLPFDVTSARSRVTFAALCREVRTSLERTSTSGGREAGAAARAAALSRRAATGLTPRGASPLRLFEVPSHPAAAAATTAAAGQSPRLRRPATTGQSPLSPRAGGADRTSSPGAVEAPAVLQSELSPSCRRARRATVAHGHLAARGTGRLLCSSDTSLATLERRWQGEEMSASPRGRDGGSSVTRHGRRASQTVKALVDRRFLYLGEE